MWKHKTKWLVRGGRKVRCYLCGKKILAEGDLFLFHGDTGYYSHQSCLVESTTISGNERRRAVKKIAAGAAIATVIAAGAGKFLDVSSQSKNSPAAQTILTSQGLILPALTSDPANPVPGQMWYRSDKGVTAHFDAIENRVIYSNRIVNGSAVVSSKGIVNGLSVLPNDGQDWGPDTTKGATAPGQYGSPYTETSGIQETQDYLGAVLSNGFPAGGTIQLLGGVFEISTTINLTTNSLIIKGIGLAADRSTTIRLADNVNESMVNVESSAFKSVIRDIAFDGNASNNTTTGNYCITASGSYNGQDLHLNQMYISNFNGTAIYSNSGIYIEDVIVEGTLNWALYLDGAVGWLVNGFAANESGVYLGSDKMTISNITITSPVLISVPSLEIAGNGNSITNVNIVSTFSQVIISGNNNNIVGFNLNAAITGSAPAVPITVSGGFNNINGVYLEIRASGVTTYPDVILSITGALNKISSLLSNVPIYGTFINIQSSYNQLSNLYVNVSLSSTAIGDSGSYNKISNVYLDGPTTSTPLVLPSTDIVRDIFMIDGSTNATIQVFTPTTSSVPASATAQENTNPYAVDVYVYGGAVTEIQITRNGIAYTVFSVSTAIAMSGQVYRLNPSDSITLTYSTAPTWEWMSD